MRWQGGRESGNVEDRRGRGGFGGGFGGMRRGGGVGIGTLLIALVLGWFLGINPLTLLGIFEGTGPVVEAPQQPAPGGTPGQPAQGGKPDTGSQFVSVVLASTEDVWSGLFRKSGSQYPAPTLVLYSGMTQTACGRGSAAAGPFYCPADGKLYIDLAFYRTLRDRLGAPGDTAQAYVIAHEVGHHVQNVTGTMRKMDAARQQVGEREYNELSVRLELQADCYAGIWAHHSQQGRNWFEQGDIEEAMNAAAAVGDDNIQRRTQGVVVPEAFTHGTSQQRARWFRTGLERGDVASCDTFSTRNP